MKQQDTNTTDKKPPLPPEDATAKKGGAAKVMLWLLFLGILVAAGTWAVKNHHIPTHKTHTASESVEKSIYQPSAPTKQTQTPESTPQLQETDISEVLEQQERAKRIRVALREDVNTLEQKLEAMTLRVEELQKTVDAMQSQPAAATQPVASPVLQADLATLNEKITLLQQDYEKRNQRYITRLQINQLLDSIAVRLRDGESYAADMRQLMLLAGDSGLNKDALNSLSTYADDGAPSLAKLMDAFDEAVNIAVPASIAAKENPSFADELRGHLSRVITIRRVSADVSDDSDEAQIARAETELRMDNVDMALAHIEQLSDPTREIFAPWTHEAEAYLAAQDAMAQLKNALTQTRAE